MSQEFIDSFVGKVDCGSNVIWINMAGDEGRAERTVKLIAEGDKELGVDGLGYQFHHWDVYSGASWNPDCKDPAEALEEIVSRVSGDALIVMRDLHLLLNSQANFGLRRQLAEMCKGNALSTASHTRPIIILADSPTPYADIKDFCDVIDFPMPDFDTILHEVFGWVTNSIKENAPDNPELVECSEELRDEIVFSLMGLTVEEGCRVLAYASARCAGFNQDTLEIIADEKCKVIRKIEGLTYTPHRNLMKSEDIGGYTDFREYLRKKSRSYSRHAQKLKQERPRGAVLVGPAGTGKTMVAKAAARDLGLDLVEIDLACLFGGIVGETETKTRRAFNTISAMPNTLALFDELEKMVGSAHENQATDSGVSSRMLSYFLRWLSERDVSADSGSRIFVMVTMNRTDNVPPELLRVGRFDRVYGTDLPEEDERLEILQIHLRKRSIDPAVYGKSLKAAVSKSEDFSGAELEGTVIDARSDAYDRAMTNYEVETAARQITAMPKAEHAKALKERKYGRPEEIQKLLEDRFLDVLSHPGEHKAELELPTMGQCCPTVEDLIRAASEITPVAKLDHKSLAAIRKFCAESTHPVNGRRTRSGPKRKSRKVETGRKTGTGNN
jgi:ATP-dependent 26S proteasome regulatory subunit